MGKLVDITENRYNMWTVLKFARKTENAHYLWLCRCDCGTIKEVDGHSLKSGTSKCCGCFKPNMKKSNLKHGGKHDRLYGVWGGIKTRCYNANDKSYKFYGDRGIKMCDEWANDYQTFKEWAYLNGYTNDTQKYVCTIDRIDYNGDYCPENCRFVNMKIQSNNKRNNLYLTYNNETHTLKEWSEIVGLSYSMLKKRAQYGWSTDRILTTPNLHTNKA